MRLPQRSRFIDSALAFRPEYSDESLTLIASRIGDADLDGDVDLSDLSSLASSYGASANVEWTQGDFDSDGDVDLSDLSSLASNYGQGEAAAFAAFQTLVPEPACLTAFAIAGLMICSRRGSLKKL